MADLQIESLKKNLREHLSRFVNDKTAGRYHPVYEALTAVRQCGEPIFLCGGAVRDFLLHGRQSAPRDLDIILAYFSEKEIDSLLKTYRNRKTKFGGISIKVRDWNLDIWPLKETWAFKEHLVKGVSFEYFPQTTFLNIDAVAIELFTKKGRPRKIYSKGFFEAILNRIMDINFEENPSPAVCIVKSLVNALKFHFMLSRKLAEYIVRNSEHITAEEMENIYQKRYANMMLSAEDIKFYINGIKKELSTTNSNPITLPKQRDKEGKTFSTSVRYIQNRVPSLF